MSVSGQRGGRLIPREPAPANGAGGGARSPVRDQVRAVEQHMRGVIDKAETSVVAIVVSHQKYPPLPALDQSVPGRLGSYNPPAPLRPFGPVPPQPGPERKLDLRDPQNVADNQFGSGIVIEKGGRGNRGLILTNYHLIDGATKIVAFSDSWMEQ